MIRTLLDAQRARIEPRSRGENCRRRPGARGRDCDRQADRLGSRCPQGFPCRGIRVDGDGRYKLVYSYIHSITKFPIPKPASLPGEMLSHHELAANAHGAGHMGGGFRGLCCSSGAGYLANRHEIQRLDCSRRHCKRSLASTSIFPTSAAGCGGSARARPGVDWPVWGEQGQPGRWATPGRGQAGGDARWESSKTSNQPVLLRRCERGERGSCPARDSSAGPSRPGSKGRHRFRLNACRRRGRRRRGGSTRPPSSAPRRGRGRTPRGTRPCRRGS